MKHTINVEDFIEWATANREDYYDFFDDHLAEEIQQDADVYLRWANKYVEEFEDDFEEIILPIIDELEEQDYFGTEGFNKRFA